MSRSRKKNPYVGLGSTGRKAIKKWKEQKNKKIRRLSVDDETILTYKKVVDIWDHPTDGRIYDKSPKGYRK